MKKSDWFLLGGVVVALPFLIKLLLWLVNDYGISPMYVTAIVIYVVLVYPQYTAMHALSMVNAYHEDEDMRETKPSNLNWILFFNDYTLVNFFGDDNLFKKLVSWVVRISIPVMIVSVAYINLLVIWVDLGPTITVVMMYAMLISIIVYLIAKSIIVIYFIYMFKGLVPSFIGILNPIGFMFITWAVKHYFASLEDIRHEETMGMDYE